MEGKNKLKTLKNFGKGLIVAGVAALIIACNGSEKKNNNPKQHITTTFFECYIASMYTDEDWDKEIAEWQEMGINTIIIGETMYGNSETGQWYTFYPGSALQGSASHFNTVQHHYDSVTKIFEKCAEAGVDVFVSMGNDENFYKHNLFKKNIDTYGGYGQESFMDMIDGILPIMQELYDLYYDDYKDIWKGWYFPPEVSNTVDMENPENFDIGVETLSGGLNKVIDKMDNFPEGNFNIMLAPYLNLREEATWCAKDPDIISSFWEEVIKATNFKMGDVLAPQDCIGVMGVTLAQLPEYTTAYRTAVDNAGSGVLLYSTVEMFHGYDYDNPENAFIEFGQSVYVSRLIQQIEAVKDIVDGFSACSFAYYYSTSFSIDGFYKTYKSYLDTGTLDAVLPSLPTTITGGVMTVDGTESLRIDFNGASDNFGIARANIYKDGELFTYRVSTRLNSWKLDEYLGKNEPTSFFDKDFDLTDGEAFYEIEVIDCAGNASKDKLGFTVTSQNGEITVTLNGTNKNDTH